MSTSTNANDATLLQPDSGAVNHVTSTKSVVFMAPTSYRMEDLILKLDELPTDYRLMGVENNPGFIIGDLRREFMLKSMSPDAVKRVYGGFYKNYVNRHDLSIVAYEYGSQSALQTDLERINTELEKEVMNNRTTITVFQNYLIIVYDDENSDSIELIVQLTDHLRSKLPGYKSPERENPVTSVTNKLSNSFTIQDLILQPDEAPAGFVPQSTMFDENIANPGFITGDLQNEILSELEALPALVKRTYGVQYGNYTTNNEIFILAIEYETSLGVQAAQKSISSSIKNMGDNATVTVFNNYLIYLQVSESVDLATTLTKQLRAKLQK